MAKDRTSPTEQINNPKRCPRKHERAYKTSFGDKLYCPDCGYNVEVAK